MIRLLALASTAAAFSPWARNDSTAYVFKSHVDGVLEKRRRKLDALRRKGGDALIRDAVGRGLHWNALGVAFPRDSRDEAFVKFAQTVVAHQPVDRAMLRHDAGRLGAPLVALVRSIPQPLDLPLPFLLVARRVLP